MSKGVVSIEFLLVLLGALLVLSAFIDIIFIISEKLEEEPEINLRIIDIKKKIYQENNWVENEGSDLCD